MDRIWVVEVRHWVIVISVAIVGAICRSNRRASKRIGGRDWVWTMVVMRWCKVLEGMSGMKGHCMNELSSTELHELALMALHGVTGIN